VASEFLPLAQVIDLIQASIIEAGGKMDERRGAVKFVMGECTISLSVELRTDGRTTLARLPSFAEGEPQVPPEYLSRISLAIRPGINVREE
jgi:hypothetical protein